ncbi:protein spaetzle-like [Topomyia yanbarensis]|uniref:protein spaetzle-like n=1 Tax=Topomyia yanbarensis TaxID=2498891 RepID=UPI00273B278A|nr:protein spaetzle-like [Topomyia yanbarensis]
MWIIAWTVCVYLLSLTVTSSDFRPLVRSRDVQESNRAPDSIPSDFVFPNELVPRIDEEECRPEFPICTNISDYPQQLVNEIIARHEQRFAEVFGNDVVVDTGDELYQRFDTSDDEPLCTSEERLVQPQSGYTMDKKLVMIVNTPNYTQGVKIEICHHPEEPCRKLDHLTSLFSTKCKQLYHYRTLLAINPVTKQPYKESFRLPSCCKCVIRPLHARLRKRRGL